MVMYSIWFVTSFFITALATPLVWKIARRAGLVDRPERHPERKMPRSETIALGGGVAVIAGVIITSVIAWAAGGLDGTLTLEKVAGLTVSLVIIIVVGLYDDSRELSAGKLMAAYICVVIATVVGGIEIGYVTNPFMAGTGPYGRSLFYFTQTVLPGISIGALITAGWLLGMMLVTKFLDGLDGLVTGLGAIGAIILFVVSLFWDIPQSSTSVLAVVFAGACLGFLVFNWHPAKIFLGESGSVFIGFMLGVLSIMSGAKIATTLLIMGIPILDVAWVIVRRMFGEQKRPFRGDRLHLHFRLLDAGLTQRQAVLLLYFFAAVFGTSSLFLQSLGKVVALAALFASMVLLGIAVMRKADKKGEDKGESRE